MLSKHTSGVGRSTQQSKSEGGEGREGMQLWWRLRRRRGGYKEVEIPNEVTGVRGAQNYVADQSLLRTGHMKEFVRVYKRRPERDNVCSICFTHAYALWLAVKLVRPRMAIEYPA